jgi:hypothetical protein
MAGIKEEEFIVSKESYNGALPFMRKAYTVLIAGLESEEKQDKIAKNFKAYISEEIRKGSNLEDALQASLAKVTSEVVALQNIPADAGIELYSKALKASGVFTKTEEVYDSTPGWLTAVYVTVAIAGVLFLCAILVPLMFWLMIFISNLIGVGM